MQKEQARIAIQEIANRFISRQAEYESGDYLESQLRMDFINDLFAILGWDIGNKANLSPLHREVLVEKGDTKGRPDYSFRVNGEDAFFIEAKAVSKGTDKPDDIFQAKRYGWNTRKVNIVVLTDFKTFKVFDASLKPDVKKPLVGLLFELQCAKFATTDFEKLWTFSREEVHKDALEKLILKDAASKRLRIPVDTAFLEQMTAWREALAKDVYKNNPEISVPSLNDVVQRLLDRLVFIRILEDRKIIESKTLREIADNWKEAKHRDLQTPLNALFKRLNEDFNGNIFKPHPCETTSYDSKVLAEIIDELYYPKSPYDFAVIGVELLGIIYEKYLGKTIRLTEKRVKVEEKPEVRKAGGVYYTPKWVVEYIVDNTVGELVKGRKPEEVAKLRILDPACGSGSFLIGALDKLFKYHEHYYIERPKEAKQGTLFPHLIAEHDEDGNVTHRLSIELKSQILKNNIYGVDIDAQACEITMMSLYIKVLEGEKTLPHNKELLPSLSNNIRCGNSLVEFDFLSQQTLLPDEEKQKVNPFEWRSKTTGFGNLIGEKGGFDAIIGNPPWLMAGYYVDDKQLEYLRARYKSAAGKFDLYYCFVELSLELLSKEGYFGMIIPNKFFHTRSASELRNILSRTRRLYKIIDFGWEKIFAEATNYSCILFLHKESERLEYIDSGADLNIKERFFVNGSVLGKSPWHFETDLVANVFKEIEQNSTPLQELVIRFGTGAQSGADKIYLVETQMFPKTENILLQPILRGKEVRRYQPATNAKSIVFPYVISNEQYVILDEAQLLKYPAISAWLNEHKTKLNARRWFKKTATQLSGRWYGLMYLDNYSAFNQPHLLTPSLSKESNFTLGKGKLFVTGTAGVTSIITKNLPEGIEYLLGLLNSRLLSVYIIKHSPVFQGSFHKFSSNYLKKVPIRRIDFTNEKEKKLHADIIGLVKRLLDTHLKIKVVGDSEPKKELLEREAKVYEEKIDKLVYELYGLTDEEVKVVENAVKS